MTLYFYDLETSGVNPRSSRIMQFAGQRVNERLEPIGEPDQHYIRLTADVLPEPEAILLTGITPQTTLAEGLSETQFCQWFVDTVCQPNTCFVGFNNIRFDDEFIRFILWRNFHDSYAWQWREGSSRWDMLDVVRMARALRPEGITWPVGSDGAPSNRLELLTAANKIAHDGAHTALADVEATIGVARLLQSAQPKLYDYLFSNRTKSAVLQITDLGKAFVYTSGRYPSEFHKTTLARTIAPHPKMASARIVFDLRESPQWLLEHTPEKIAELMAWRSSPSEERPKIPIKTLHVNRAPAVASPAVVDDRTAARLGLDKAVIATHQALLDEHQEALAVIVQKVYSLLEKQVQPSLLVGPADVDRSLYDGFVTDADRRLSHELTGQSPAEIKDYVPHFQDQRLNALFPLYKARNFPQLLSSEEQAAWQAFCESRLHQPPGDSPLERFFVRLGELAQRSGLTTRERYLLEELQLYGQSLVGYDRE